MPQPTDAQLDAIETLPPNPHIPRKCWRCGGLKDWQEFSRDELKTPWCSLCKVCRATPTGMLSNGWRVPNQEEIARWNAAKTEVRRLRALVPQIEVDDEE